MYLKFFAVTTSSSSLMFHLVIITMSSSSIIKDSTCNMKVTVKGVGVDDDCHHAPEDARVLGEEDC